MKGNVNPIAKWFLVASVMFFMSIAVIQFSDGDVVGSRLPTYDIGTGQVDLGYRGSDDGGLVGSNSNCLLSYSDGGTPFKDACQDTEYPVCYFGKTRERIHFYNSTDTSCSGKIQDIDDHFILTYCDDITPPNGFFYCGSNTNSNFYVEPIYGDQNIQTIGSYSLCCKA